MSPRTDREDEWFDDLDEWGRPRRAWLAVWGLAFAILLASAPIGWLLLRPVATRASVSPPEWTWASFANGDAMRQTERHAKEASWVTLQVRGLFNETLLRLGLLESELVTIGTGGWMYLTETMHWRPDLLAESRERRLQILRAARDLMAAAGIELLVVPVPDKVTIHPEGVPPGALDPGRTQLYDQILADLAAVGVAHVDVRAVLRACRAARDAELLYYFRDTHWRLPGQQAAANAVRDRLAAEGWMAQVRTEPRIVVLEPRERIMLPGLVSMLGLRAENDTDGGWSATVRALAETVPWLPVLLREPGAGDAPLPDTAPEATVALCGTSFSQSFGPLLCGALGAIVDRRFVVPGGGSFAGLRKLAAALAAGQAPPRIVVWEFVERHYQTDWIVTQSLLE